MATTAVTGAPVAPPPEKDIKEKRAAAITRRGVLGAMTVAPIVVAVPASATAIGFSPEWEAALHNQQRARAAMDEFYARKVKPVVTAEERGEATYEQVAEQESAWTPYTSDHADAVNELVTTPAPTFDGLIYKIDIARRDALFDGSSTCDAAIASILSDLRRLAGRA